MGALLNWKSFGYKYDGREPEAFEKLAYALFCRKYGLAGGVPRRFNRWYVETDPVKVGDDYVGFQAKYYVSPTVNDDQARALADTVRKAQEKYPQLTVLQIYLANEFSNSKNSGIPKRQEEIEKVAKECGIRIEWVLPSNFEIILNQAENADLKKYFFAVETSDGSWIPKCLTTYLPVGPEIGLVGRDQIVNELRAMLDAEKCVALVIGLGGIGKTAVMQKVCDNILTDGNEENHVAWITCGESLEDDLLTLRDAFGVPKEMGRKQAFETVFRELQTFPGTLYLFLDDLSRDSAPKDLEKLNALSPNVHIMITSRREIRGVPCVELDKLDEDSAVEMFYGYYGRDEEREYLSDVKKIIGYVSHNTLLIELLAKAANRSFNTLDVFRREIDEKGLFAVDYVRIDGQNDEITTIEKIVGELYDISGLSGEQKRIMGLFSIFTPEKEIYGKVVEWAGLDDYEVSGLVGLGWLDIAETGFIIHQIVRDLIARQVGESLRIEEYGDLLERVADTDNYMPRTLEYTKVRERLFLAEDVARHVERRLGRIIKAEEWSEKDIPFLKGCADLFRNIAGVYKVQEDYSRALEYYGRALATYESVLGTESQDISTIANEYREKGDYEKALELYEKTLSVFAIRIEEKSSSSEVLTDDYSGQISVIRNQINDFFKQDSQEYYSADAFLDFLRRNNTDDLRRLISKEMNYLFRISENDNIIPVHNDAYLQLLLYQIWMIDTQRLKEQIIVTKNVEKAVQDSQDTHEQHDNGSLKKDEKQDTAIPNSVDLEKATLSVVESFQEWVEKELEKRGKKCRIIQQAYRQSSGDQHGYDVGLELQIDRATYKLSFECKDYTSNIKEEGKNSNINIRAYALNLLKYFINSKESINNRWVLVNPFGDLQNDYPDILFETWNRHHKHVRIFAITETQVYPTCKDFFSVDESAYKIVYPENNLASDRVDKRDKVFSYILDTIIGDDYVSKEIQEKLKWYKLPKKFLRTQSSDLLLVRTLDGDIAIEEILRCLTIIKGDTSSESKKNGIYIIGAYGSGKTWLLNQTIVEIINHPAKYPFVPVLMKLKEVPVEKLNNKDVEDYIISSIAEQYVERVLEKQGQLEEYSMLNMRPVFMLDGFDEVVSGLSATNNKIRILLSIRDKLKKMYRDDNPVFIVTSRESDFHACQSNKEFIELFNQFYKITLEDCPSSETKEKLLEYAKKNDVKMELAFNLTKNPNVLEIARRAVFYELLIQLIEGGNSSIDGVVDEFSLLNNAINKEISRPFEELKQANKNDYVAEEIQHSLLESLLNSAIECTKNNGNEAPIILAKKELVEVIPNGLVSVKNKHAESATPKRPWIFKTCQDNVIKVSFQHNIVREFLVAKKFFILIEKCVSAENAEKEEQDFFDLLRSVQMSPESLRFFLIFVQKREQEGAQEEIKEKIKNWLCRPDIKERDSDLSAKLLEMLLQPGCTFGGNEKEPLDLTDIHADNLCIWNCKLEHLNLRRAFLRNMQMTDIQLDNVDLREADLSGLRFAPSKPIIDICHFRKNTDWHIAVLYQNGQVLKYSFTNRFMQDQYSVKLLQKFEDATGLFTVNDTLYIIISGKTIYPLEDNNKYTNTLYSMSSGKSIQRIISDGERNRILVLKGKDYWAQLIGKESLISHNIDITESGNFYLTKDGMLVFVSGNEMKLIFQTGSTKSLCKWENNYECFTIRQRNNGENNIYIKTDDRLIQVIWDEEYNNKPTRTEYQIDGICGTLREIRVINDDILVGISESDLYIMTIKENIVIVEKLNTAVEASRVLLGNENGRDQMKDPDAYKLLSGSIVPYEETGISE